MWAGTARRFAPTCPADREPGVRERAEPDLFDRFEPYVRQRLGDDQHVWATVLFAEVVGARLSAGRIRRSPGSCATGSCARTASRARRATGGRTWTSSIPPVRRSSGTGSSSTTRRGAPRPTCSSVRCRTRAGSGAGSPRPMTRPISWSGSTRSCAASAARRGGGGSIGWPRSSSRAPTSCSVRSCRWPSTTASVSIRARRGTATARVWSRRRSTTSPSRGGAPPAVASPAEAQAERGPVLCRRRRPDPSDPAAARRFRRPSGDIHSSVRRREPLRRRLPAGEPLPGLQRLPGRARGAHRRRQRVGVVVGQPLLGPTRPGRRRTSRSAGGSAPTPSPSTPPAPS